MSRPHGRRVSSRFRPVKKRTDDKLWAKPSNAHRVSVIRTAGTARRKSASPVDDGALPCYRRHPRSPSPTRAPDARLARLPGAGGLDALGEQPPGALRHSLCRDHREFGLELRLRKAGTGFPLQVCRSHRAVCVNGDGALRIKTAEVLLGSAPFVPMM